MRRSQAMRIARLLGPAPRVQSQVAAREPLRHGSMDVTILGLVFRLAPHKARRPVLLDDPSHHLLLDPDLTGGARICTMSTIEDTRCKLRPHACRGASFESGFARLKDPACRPWRRGALPSHAAKLRSQDHGESEHRPLHRMRALQDVALSSAGPSRSPPA